MFVDPLNYLSEEAYLDALEEVNRPLATKQDACREYAANVGEMRAEQEWILTDYDTWEPNPWYQGRKGPHPEDHYYWQLTEAEQAEYLADLNAPPPVRLPPLPETDDDVPF